MKHFLLLLILIYQKIFSTVLKNILGINKFCRFSPTCSQYAKESILKYGALRGGYLSVTRIINCR
ncbi:MAG: membrane protein insertion efficiency factor YidD [Candidatus Levybacteria bacterium]|nr:membrane protein insertion efficiency factor YidD [Candidatus Levybacteria bacterium]